MVRHKTFLGLYSILSAIMKEQVPPDLLLNAQTDLTAIRRFYRVEKRSYRLLNLYEMYLGRYPQQH